MTPISRLSNAKSTYREDVDSLLQLAEKQRDRCEAEQKILSLEQKYLLTQSSILVIGYGVSLFVAFYFKTNGSEIWQVLSLIIIGLGLVFFIPALNRSRMRLIDYKTRLSLSRRRLGEVVEILREIEPAIAEEEDWSALKKAEYRIRLSEYDIDSVANYKD